MKNWLKISLSAVLSALLFGGTAIAGSRPRFGASDVGFTFTGSQSLANLDMAVSTNQSIYLDGNSRVQGFSFNGTQIRVLGNVPLTPAADQSISFGGAATRWSNSYIFTMNTWDPVVHSDFVDDSATTGNRTVNASRGFNAFAAATAAITITNSKVTATSQIHATIMTNDATALLKNCVPAAGSFTCNLNANTTGITKIAWLVTK